MSRRRRKGREINGLLLLDKPAGITSNLALQKVKKLFNAAKAGHTGSLDPLATGLLVICFGRATKISDYLLTADKQYEMSLKLGITTDTADADGKIIAQQDASSIKDEDIHQTIKFLTGNIEQVPPMYSSLKHQGARLYALARQGIEVKRQPRTVQIHKFELIKRDRGLLHMYVHCSKGTYVRTLAEDLGKQLGCGAHVVGLRRTSLGPFVNPKLHTMLELENYAEPSQSSLDEMLFPIDYALKAWPALSFDQTLMENIRNGHPVWVPKSPAEGKVRIYDANDQFYGIGTVLKDGRIAPKRLN